MNCMKCGREIALGQVFCKECLADMSQYPVKPETPVPLFVQPAAPQPKRNSNTRKAKRPEEQIIYLKKWILGMGIALLAAVLCFTIVTSFMAHRIYMLENETPTGQNYSTSDSTK